MKKKGIKTYVGIVVVTILALVLANPNWLPLSDELKAAVRETEKSNLLFKGDAHATIAQLITLLLALAIVWLSYQLLRLIFSAIGKKGSRLQTVTDLITGLLKYVAVIVAVVWGLGIIGVNTTAVLAGVGIVGLILGFGAQSLIEDIITGFFIIFEGEYGIGDIIILDDFRGVVRNIGVRTTVIEDAGGNLKIVNNSDIRNLQNRSKNNSLAVSDIGVAYDTDISGLRAKLVPELQKVYEKRPDLYLSPPMYMGVENLGDSSITLRFHAETRETDIFAARRQLNEDIFGILRNLGVAIPFPQVVVHPAEKN